MKSKKQELLAFANELKSSGLLESKYEGDSMSSMTDDLCTQEIGLEKMRIGISLARLVKTLWKEEQE